MDRYTETEYSYRNGFEKGFEKAKEEYGPLRETGVWRKTNYTKNPVCSVCRHEMKDSVKNFCPCCGSIMKTEEYKK